MHITEITAGWQETCSLGNYSNVKPSLSVRATVEPGEDPEAARERLTALCRDYVREQVDLALEAEGEPAKYSADPRFDIITFYFGFNQGRAAALVPEGETQRFYDLNYSTYTRGHRLASARRKLAEFLDHRNTESYRVFDCGDDSAALNEALAVIGELKAAERAEQARREAEREEQRRQQEAEWEAERVRRQARDADDDDGQDDEE